MIGELEAYEDDDAGDDAKTEQEQFAAARAELESRCKASGLLVTEIDGFDEDDVGLEIGSAHFTYLT